MTETLTRREFVATTAATVGLLAGTHTTAAQEWTDERGGWAPDHVTHVGDDVGELELYQPRLITTVSDRRQMIGMFGAYMDSDEYDTRAYSYWLKYTHQDSVLDRLGFLSERFAADAHLGDHEPFIAFVDPDTGAVEEVVYTGYHHYAVKLGATDANLSAEAADDPTHTPLEVVSPHHHYRLGEADAGTLASNTTDMDSFLTAFEDWDEQGIWDSSDRQTVRDPWRARERGHWWKAGTWDHRLAQIRVLMTVRDEHDDLLAW